MSTNREPALAVPAHLRRLVDDAALFPPGNAPLEAAVEDHRRRRASDHADLVGPFVVGDRHLPALRELVAGQPPLAIALVVSGGAGAVEPAVRWATAEPALEVRSVEIALRDEADLAHNARRMTMVVDRLRADGLLPDDAAVHVEPPRPDEAGPSASWLAALDELAVADVALKFRTGGPDDDVPSSSVLASCIGSALDRELPFKCTAGLHRAVRQLGPPGAGRHGFLNVLLATRASLDAASPDEVAAQLDLADAAQVAALLAQAGSSGLVSARRWFTSFGSCSIDEPLDDLVALGLVSAAATPG